ncbi:FAD-dependent pyridine nucleotide-disulphide oxidoreductase [Gloeothece citriformis PCC 7424]|uniref:NADH:ubiquinone reductase (non-electrogenic) n=1 Tax=Gloeothece citriformis (strain PCC 7424) TaxID=65393 RepID=B7KHI9_GLOC7|nr:NAD(P)/FAD-dependent oxidoreductase [Gloeothece citriformis]ACK70684.1 FAD-dependent pyridine nucleotide-disulphide oxidoreductase [Gloeothece citriformis PCC 7424]
MKNNSTQKPRVVIVGGGFAGLYTAKALKDAPVDVTLIDKRNFHLFQPLLYQVATGNISPADISSPLRLVLRHHKNTQVILDEVLDVDPHTKQLILKGHEPISYDMLIVATGVSHFYFGNDHWQTFAPGLKTIEDALEIRRRIYMAFEAAEKETDPEIRQAWLTFVIVGGGPTGVELAGAIAEIAHSSLEGDFRQIDTTATQILLLEGMDRILPPYPPELSVKAQESLTKLGVTVQTKTLVTNVTEEMVTVRQEEQVKNIAAKTILWAAGVKASKMGEVLAQRTGAKLDRAGRVMVEPDLSVVGHPDLFVIGDLANFSHQGDKPLPGVAPVAMQQGEYMAKLIKKRITKEPIEAFYYIDRGSLAVIGQNSAVVNLGFVKLSGFLAWLIWVWAHIYYLIEFDNKLVVMVQWGWNYFTQGRGARLITGEASPSTFVEVEARENKSRPHSVSHQPAVKV